MDQIRADAQAKLLARTETRASQIDAAVAFLKNEIRDTLVDDFTAVCTTPLNYDYVIYTYLDGDNTDFWRVEERMRAEGIRMTVTTSAWWQCRFKRIDVHWD